VIPDKSSLELQTEIAIVENIKTYNTCVTWHHSFLVAPCQAQSLTPQDFSWFNTIFSMIFIFLENNSLGP
jgi:hypothetical protein